MAHRAPRKLRIPFFSKGRNTPPPLASQPTPSQDLDDGEGHIPPSGGDDYGDRERTITRYKEAANVLQEAIKSRQGSWELFDLQGLTGEPADFDDAQFRDKINLSIVSKGPHMKDQHSWSKCKQAIECIFTALSPFAKNFLKIAKDVQSVCPLLYGI